MSTSTIVVNHNDETEEVEVYVMGGDGSKARAIAEHIMMVASSLQGDNARPPYSVEVN